MTESEEPDGATEDQDRLVTVDRFFHPTDAHIAAGLLESDGIPVNLLGINHASANWLISNALGGIRLQVPGRFAGRARELLAEVAENEAPPRELCPHCGSPNSTAHSARWKISFLAVHLLSIPLPWGRDERQCGDCGQPWETTDVE